MCVTVCVCVSVSVCVLYRTIFDYFSTLCVADQHHYSITAPLALHRQLSQSTLYFRFRTRHRHPDLVLETRSGSTVYTVDRARVL